MSQVDHRRRLREQQQAAAERANLATFKKQTTARHTVPAADVVQHPAVPAMPAAAVITQPTPAGLTIGQPAVVPVAPAATAAIVPVGANTPGMTPSKLREHAQQTAELIAQLPQAEYRASLQALEANNPVLYSIVVDELNNMAAQAGTNEGDGFDLSGITNVTPAQDATGQYPNPKAPDALGELQGQ